MATVKFEDAMVRLETIVSELENGDLSLDESLRIFEEGVRLSKSCLKLLDDTEQKIEILLKEKDGKRRLRAYTVGEKEVDETPQAT